MKLASLYHLVFLFIAGLSIFHAQAATPNMKLHGILIEPPNCSIDNDKKIDVFFGKNIGINRIDGVNYTENIKYSVSCLDDKNNWSLSLKIIGAKADFDPYSLITNFEDLAIRIKLNGKPLLIGESVPISAVNLPKLTAVPIKRPGAKLKKGDFTVTATLMAEYQ